jgi:hypothetical protein
MGFKDRLKMFDLLAFLTASTRKVLTYFVGDDDASFVAVSRTNPFPVEVVVGGTGGGGSTPALVPLGNHLTLTLDGTAKSPTWPPGTLGARIGVSGGSARVAVSNPAPTATTGLLWADGSTWDLNEGDLAGFKAALASGAAVLDIQPLGAP